MEKINIIIIIHLNIMIKFDNLQRVLAEFGNALSERYKEKLTEDNRIASGRLISSVNSKVVVNDNEFIVELNLEDWWKFIEYGTKPHMPPVNKILEWVVVKRILPTPMKNGKLPTEQQLAWMIAKKIEREGTEGTPNLTESIDEMVNEYEQKIEEALDADVLSCIDDIFTIFK